MPLGVMRKHIKYYNFDINTTLYIHQICAFYHCGYGFTTKAITTSNFLCYNVLLTLLM